VLAGLFARDARYAAHNEEWAALAAHLKQLALADASPSAILDDLAAQIVQIEKSDHANPAR
jgi:hypothetical protein